MTAELTETGRHQIYGRKVGKNLVGCSQSTWDFHAQRQAGGLETEWESDGFAEPWPPQHCRHCHDGGHGDPCHHPGLVVVGLPPFGRGHGFGHVLCQNPRVWGERLEVQEPFVKDAQKPWVMEVVVQLQGCVVLFSRSVLYVIHDVFS